MSIFVDTVCFVCEVVCKDSFLLILYIFVLFFFCNISSGLWSFVSNFSSLDFIFFNSFSVFGNFFNLIGGECLILVLLLMSCGYRRKVDKV